MNDLLEAFGITKDDLNGDNRKEEQKEKRGKKTTHSSKKEKMFSFPICFNAGHLRHVFADDKETNLGQWSEKTLKKNLEDEFPELKGICYDLISVKNENQSEIVTAQIVYSKLNDVDKIEFPAEIVAGEISIPITEAESMQDIEKLWTEEHPEYTGCNFHYIPSSRFLIPYMEPNCPEGKQYEFPITVGYLDIKETYTQDDFEESNCSLEQIRKKYAESYPEFRECEFAYQEELNLLFPIMKTNKEEKEKKIALPVEVRAGGFVMQMQAEDFEQKSSVTLEEIRKVLEIHYPEYSKERTEMIYDKQHFIVPILKSSRKGVIIQGKAGWDHQIYTDKYGNQWRRETTPFGIFTVNITKKTPVQFQFTLPKIPRHILRQVINIFESTPDFESAVQIFYNPVEKCYEIYKPLQKVTSTEVLFQRDMKQESNNILIMDIHSHGRFLAFFSMTDNMDEKGIRLYMVIGNLDQKEHSYALRAGLAGYFGKLQLVDIFE